MSRDYYEILGIDNDSSKDQIKKAYRRLAHKYHPDRNQEEGSEEKFKEVSTAYEVLSDPQKKQNYDQYGQEGMPSGVGGSCGFGSSDPFDLFNNFCGGRTRQRQRGSDLRIQIDVALEEVLSGCERQVTYKRNNQCASCKGLGGTGSSCKTCGGYGQVEQRTNLGYIASTCPSCRGSGVQITLRCTSCKGRKSIPETRTVLIKIPPGVQSRNQLKISNEGEISDHRLPPGDLICIIHVKNHSDFKRKAQDIQCVHSVSFTDACLGTTEKIKLLDGTDVDLKIPPGTQFGQSLRLKGQGLPVLNRNHRGDLHVVISIPVPTTLTETEKKALKSFDKKTKDKGKNKQK